jgi:hypothetical protein
LDRDVQAGLGAGEEVDDHLLQVVGGTQLWRPDVGLDLSLSEGRHGPMVSLVSARVESDRVLGREFLRTGRAPTHLSNGQLAIARRPEQNGVLGIGAGDQVVLVTGRARSSR